MIWLTVVLIAGIRWRHALLSSRAFAIGRCPPTVVALGEVGLLADAAQLTRATERRKLTNEPSWRCSVVLRGEGFQQLGDE
jgi:hypothetical protein